MKTLSTGLATQAASNESSWAELYDFYLHAAIITPFGTVQILRLTTLPGGLSFFTPLTAPEASGTQGNAASYEHWVLGRKLIRGSTKFSSDKLAIAASNVSGEWAQMLADVEWNEVPVLIRKVSMAISNPTANDATPIFSGRVDRAKVTLRQIEFTCSNGLAGFNAMVPRENMHATCRFQWADERCGQLRYAVVNYQTKTCGAASTTSIVKSAGLTEDQGTAGSYGTDLIEALADGAITTSSQQTDYEGFRVKSSYSATDHWRFQFSNEWGDLLQGYWHLNGEGFGLHNGNRKPWIQFDFGSAVQPQVWRIRGRNDLGREVLPRLVQISASMDDGVLNWNPMISYELPPEPGKLFDIHLHNPLSLRYWRIGIRTRWADTLNASAFSKIEAYAARRNWWQNGAIRFLANTPTVALRNVSRTVLASYAGELHVASLPVAPAAGDQFTIERGCGRTFNDCAVRQNYSHFGGFDSMPTEATVR
ncbi:MAG: phage BR0599 family protein [Verrucomicrobiota bacterium]|nr:phage BR0599 family protein [Verrucomicrobiota bacterium]